MVDVEGGFRAWLRAQATSAGDRVFLDVKGSPTFPYVTVGLIDAAEDGSDAPLDVTLVQLDAWGANKPQAHALYTELRASLRTAECGTTLTAGTTLRGTPVVTSVLYLPDGQDATPRYIITAQVLAGP